MQSQPNQSSQSNQFTQSELQQLKSLLSRNIEDLEKRRFYVQLFEMKLAGYILDESKFKVIPAINRTLTVLEVVEKPKTDKLIIKTNIQTTEAIYTFIFKPSSDFNFTFTSEFDVKFISMVNIVDITNIKILVNNVEKVNGLVLSTPLIISAGDSVYIEVVKNINDTGKFQLIGNLI